MAPPPRDSTLGGGELCRKKDDFESNGKFRFRANLQALLPHTLPRLQRIFLAPVCENTTKTKIKLWLSWPISRVIRTASRDEKEN